jgi:hypothetical protein
MRCRWMELDRYSATWYRRICEADLGWADVEPPLRVCLGVAATNGRANGSRVAGLGWERKWV